MKKTTRSIEEWKESLTPEQFRVTRLKGTEPPFTGLYNDCKEEGLYRCVCCNAELFRSDEKFDSGTGWPSFFAPAAEDNLRTEEDTSHGIRRIEVLCGRCDAHLGHLFPDGPPPSGVRYCINSAALKLDPKEDGGKDGSA